MPDEITNKMLLEHIQSNKQALLLKMNGMEERMGGIEKRMNRIENNLCNLSERVEFGFREAELDRKAIQEDLNITIAIQAKHKRKLEKIAA